MAVFAVAAVLARATPGAAQSHACHVDELPDATRLRPVEAALGWEDRGCHRVAKVLGPRQDERSENDGDLGEGMDLGGGDLDVATIQGHLSCPTREVLKSQDVRVTLKVFLSFLVALFVIISSRWHLFSCSSLTHLPSQLLPKAGFDCVEEIARVLSHKPAESTIKSLIHEAKTSTDPWARRNGLRVLGEFCWTISNCRQVDGVGCTLIPGCEMIIKGKERKSFRSALKKCINEETHDKPLDDALWIAGAFFKPFPELKKRYQDLVLDERFPPVTRVRATQAWNFLVSSQKNQTAADLDFLQVALKITEIPAIPRLMSVTSQYIMASLTKTQLALIHGALNKTVMDDKNLLDRVDIAQALDRYNGNDDASAQLKKWIVNNYFKTTKYSTYKGSRIMIRSSFDIKQTACWTAMLEREWRAFEELTGPDFAKPMGNRSTCGPINVLIFPDNKAYHSYMTAFVGFAANAGGLYVKKFNTLFTYQRTGVESYITVEELILHEFGHYLQGCYVLPGKFGTEAYDKEPKGFIDEGLAEFWATLNFDRRGCFSLPLRENYMKRICRNMQYPKWHLKKLVFDRKGYDENGVFHYMQAYTLNYFLMTQHRDVAKKILHALRRDEYDDKDWEKLTGRPLSQWNSLWHIALDSYCDKKVLQHYPVKCPVSKPDDGYHQCQVYGHGYSTKLWHAAPTKIGTVPWWHRTEALGDANDGSADDNDSSDDDSSDPAVIHAAAVAAANGLPMAATDLGEPDLGEADEMAAHTADVQFKEDLDLQGMREDRVNEDAMNDGNRLVDALEFEDRQIDQGMRNLGPQGISK